jgi:hypothetical protein
MKFLFFLIFAAMSVILISGCAEEAERENPLDSKNKRTGGAPPGLIAQAGDSKVTLSWSNLGLEGIVEYRIYRAYLDPNAGEFQFVATVPAGSTGPVFEYTDTGLQNDGDNKYYYRLSYVDRDGFEIPDPDDPQNLPQGWFLLSIIPSKAPPAPDVRVVEDPELQGDLQVRLNWEGYLNNAPDDIAGFKIYSAPKAEEGFEQQPLNLVAKIDDPKVEFYIDGNDYDNEIINFWGDGVTKLYQVVAYDEVGVESDSPVIEGTSPNLPPSPPPQVRGNFFLGINSYDVRIEWNRNPEPDLIGYVIYALLPDGTREFKKIINDVNETVAIISDRYVVFEGLPVPKQYYVTAFDRTPREDGKRDESEPSEILSAM